MTHPSSLTLNDTERVAVTRELRRYSNYRRGEGDGLLDAHLLPETDDEDGLPGLTDDVQEAAASHFALADQCEALADELDARQVVPVSASHLELISVSLREAHPDEMPPELSHASEFADLVTASLDGGSQSSEPEQMLFLVREGNPLPPSPPIPAPARAPRTEHEALEGRVTQLIEHVGSLEARLEAQQKEIDALRSQTSRGIRSQRADPLGSAPRRRAAPERGGLSL